MEQLEKQDKTVRKLKKQLKVFAKKINDLEGTCHRLCLETLFRNHLLNLCNNLNLHLRCLMFICVDVCLCIVGGQMDVSPGQTADESVHPVNIPRREKDFQGMLEYKKEDELKLVKNLILGKTHRPIPVKIINLLNDLIILIPTYPIPGSVLIRPC